MCLWFWTVIILAAFKSIYLPSQLCWCLQHSDVACFACFSADYVYLWDYIWLDDDTATAEAGYSVSEQHKKFCFSLYHIDNNSYLFVNGVKIDEFKACVCYFYQILKAYHFIKWYAFKNYEVFFIWSKKLFSFSRYSNFYNFFPSFPHIPDSKGQMEVE